MTHKNRRTTSSQQENKKLLDDKCPENMLAESLTSYHVLAKNTLWNLTGQVAPLLVAIVAIPFLVKTLGVERFGVLMLVLMFIGYFSLFDLGLGRALTRMVAGKLGYGQPKDIPMVVWTALGLMGILGFLGGVVLGLLAPWLVHSALKIPGFLRIEALGSFYLIAVSIPIVISTAGLVGVLEAYQRFDLINAMRIPMGLFVYLSPLIVVVFTQSLIGIVAVLVVGRISHWIAHLWLCLRVVPALRRFSVHSSSLRPLLSFGSWVTVTNIISPVMMYMDRFLISVLVSMAAVAYYATPHEVVTKLTVIPIAIVGVLFPAFSSSLVKERERAVTLFDRGVNYTFLVLFPISLVIVALAQEGLQFWLGIEFAQKSTRVLQLLTIGLLLNGLARIPFALVQAEGRSDLTAKLHLIELPFYLLAMWWLLATFGIEGAAIAWVIRVTLDTLILFAMAYWLIPETSSSIRSLTIMIFGGIFALILCAITTGLFLKIVLLLLIMVTFTTIAWFLILKPNERHLVKGKLIHYVSFSFRGRQT